MGWPEDARCTRIWCLGKTGWPWMAHGAHGQPRKWSMKHAGSSIFMLVCWRITKKTPGSFGKYENGGTHALLQLDSVRRLHLLMVLGLFIPCPRLRPVFGSTCTSEASRRLNLVSTLPSEQPPWYGGSCRVPTISNQRHVGYQNDLHQNPASSAS